MIKNKQFIYIPSFSAGSYGNSIKKDLRFKNGRSVRLYAEDQHPLIKHNWFLSPAGHFYKKLEYKETIGIHDEVNLLGDSGGFQIASGAIKWDISIRDKIFQWLEHNSTFAINLDIPPKIKYLGKFEECLELSKENFKYFSEKQTGKTKFLNVLHGETPEKYLKWYNEVKDFDFNGWCLGGAAANLSQFLSAIAVFVETNEHKNSKNEIVHFLGISKIIDFFILSQLQRSFETVGSSLQVSTDSSSPNNTTRFGGYYSNANLKLGSFSQIHIPKLALNLGENMKVGEKLPWLCSADYYLQDCYDYDDLHNMTPEMYAVMVLHNFAIFKDTCRQVHDLTNGHPYILEQLVNKDIITIMKIIDEMVICKENGDSPVSKYKQNKMIIDSISSRLVELTIKPSINEFF